MAISMEQPITGGMHNKINTGPFIFHLVARNAPPSVAMIWTTPKGMLNRIVVKLEAHVRVSFPSRLAITLPVKTKRLNNQRPKVGDATARNSGYC